MTVATRGGVELAAAWRLLALGFSTPTEETLEEVGALAGALLDVHESPELDALLQAVAETTPGDLGTQHAALFRGTVRVAPYEGSYERDPIRQGRQMADVAAFYRAFGAEAHGPVPERPDFVGCELEFLSFLELRRLAAEEVGEDGREILDDIRDAFLADHAGRWLPAFFAEVVAAAEAAPMYWALASFGPAVITDELERHGLDRAALPQRSPTSSLDADLLECGTSETDVPL